MPEIRYVCLSDLHFGAENSILSCLVDGGVVVDPTTASPVLDGLAAALAVLIGANDPTSPKPTLILNGDILELALATDNVALMVFELFLDRIFLPGRELFDPTILYLPGNHDHHLWEAARERQYANLLNPDVPNGLKPGALLPIPWHGTSLYYREDPRPVACELLEQLARRKHRDQRISVRVAYPNLGIRSEDAKTSVIFHHGHNVESIYHLMTTLKDYVFPGRPAPSTVFDIEAENFAWIDFFWSTLGRSGDVGEDVGLVYDMLQSTPAIKQLAGNLAAGIAKKVPRTGVIGWFHWLIRRTLDTVLKRVASTVAASERKWPTQPLSNKAQEGLLAYLGGPLVTQLAAEPAQPGGPLPEQVKFVFGHTHKPFQCSLDVPGSGLANQVRIFNSGGWVVDTLTSEKMHGANLVLIDETLEVACVRMYNQAAAPGDYRVHLDDTLAAEQGPFYQRLSGLINPAEEPWRSFSAATADLVAQRQTALATIIANAGKPRKQMPAPGGGT